MLEGLPLLQLFGLLSVLDRSLTRNMDSLPTKSFLPWNWYFEPPTPLLLVTLVLESERSAKTTGKCDITAPPPHLPFELIHTLG